MRTVLCATCPEPDLSFLLGRLIFFLMSIKSDALARPLPTFVDVFNVIGQLPGDYSRGTVAIVKVVQSNVSGVITMEGTKGKIGTPPHTSMFTVVLEPEVCLV